MKRLSMTLALLALTILVPWNTILGQVNNKPSGRYDWVKHYHGLRDDDICSGILEMEVDNQGNVYVMGQFTMDANIDGEYFLPTQHQSVNNKRSFFVAKLSPDGTMIWHKAIHHTQHHVFPKKMRLVGDTALMLMANFDMPLSNNTWSRLYYLDTMIVDNNGYPYSTDSSTISNADGIITLDPDDGHLLEHHFLQRALLDTAGNVFRHNSQGRWITDRLGASEFDVDSHGNIYLVRRTYDEATINCDTCQSQYRTINPIEGSVGGVRIFIDGVRWIDYKLPYATGSWNQQLMKFSPHFDSLLDATYIERSTTSTTDTSSNFISNISVSSFNIHNDRLCICLGLDKYHDGATVERSDTLVFHNPQQYFDIRQDAMLIYDTNLHPHQLVQLDPLNPQESNLGPTYGTCRLSNTAYDADSNSLFIIGISNTHPITIPSFGHDIAYRGDTLALSNSVFFLRIEPDNGSLISYGTATTSTNFSLGGCPNIVVNGNRVFAEVVYASNIYFGDTSFYTASHGVNMGVVSAIGLAQWDYAGHEIAFHDFHAQNGPTNVGPVALHDSVLYFSGVAFNATFGDISLPGSNTFIGRYVDESFMTPYIYDNRHADQYITWNTPTLNDTIYVEYPGHDINISATSSSGLPVEFLLSNDTITYFITDQRLWISDTGTFHITAIQPGNTYWNAAQPVEKIIHVGPVDGRIIWDQPLELVYSDTIIHLDAEFIIGNTYMTFELPAGNGVAEFTEVGSHELHILGPGTVDIKAIAWRYNPNSDDGNYSLTRTLVVYSKPIDPIGIDAVATDIVKAYPNPSTSKVSIMCPEPIASAWLINMFGQRKEVRLTSIGNRQYSLDLSSLPQAAYFLTLTTTSGKTHTIKLMKKSNIFEN